MSQRTGSKLGAKPRSSAVPKPPQTPSWAGGSKSITNKGTGSASANLTVDIGGSGQTSAPEPPPVPPSPVKHSGISEENEAHAPTDTDGRAQTDDIPGTPVPPPSTPEEGEPDKKAQLRTGSLLWRRLSKHVQEDEGLKADFKLHNSLFGQHVTQGVHAPETTKELIQVMKARRFVILPGNLYRLYWDLLQLIILVYLAWVVPLRVGFAVRAKGGWFALDILIDVYFAIDIAVNFCTAFIDPSDYKLVTEPRRIARHYLRTWFLLDLVALLPVDYVSRGLAGTFWCSLADPASCTIGATSGSYLKLIRMLRLVKLMKLLRLMKMSDLFERYQDELFEVLQLIGVLRIVAGMVFLAHMLGCMWYFFADEAWLSPEEREDPHRRPWMEVEFGEHYQDKSLGIRYMAAIYWAFTTMTTVGYGDITATSMMERMWASLAMLAGTFSFSWICGSIVQELEVHYMQQMAYNQKMVGVHSFVKDMQLDRATRCNVLSYFRTQNIKSYDERSLLFELPFELRTSILTTLYRELIESVPLFVTGDKIFITELCSRVVPMSMVKGAFVYKHGEAANNMYLISQGEVEVTGSEGHQVAAVFGKGVYFGEGCCFGEKRRKHSIRCRSGITLLSLHVDEMAEVLSMFPHVAMQMKQICDARNRQFALKLKDDDLPHSASAKRSMLFTTGADEEAAFTPASAGSSKRWAPSPSPSAAGLGAPGEVAEKLASIEKEVRLGSRKMSGVEKSVGALTALMTKLDARMQVLEAHMYSSEAKVDRLCHLLEGRSDHPRRDIPSPVLDIADADSALFSHHEMTPLTAISGRMLDSELEARSPTPTGTHPADEQESGKAASLGGQPPAPEGSSSPLRGPKVQLTPLHPPGGVPPPGAQEQTGAGGSYVVI